MQGKNECAKLLVYQRDAGIMRKATRLQQDKTRKPRHVQQD